MTERIIKGADGRKYITTEPLLNQGPDYERGFIDGMQKQMQSSVDKAVNAMAQPAPVQEPVAFFDPQKESFYWAKPTRVIPPVTVDVEPLPLYTTPPAAQLSVPDEITAAIENPEYRDGWNDCRALMLEMRKP
jgi:hypothetical protein